MRIHATVLCCVALAATGAAQSAPPSTSPSSASPIGLFLREPATPPPSYRATRRLEARNTRFNASGWMDVDTTFDGDTFTWRTIAEGGSAYVRNKVLRRALDGEAEAVARRDPQRAAINTTNYDFLPASDVRDGMAQVPMKPKRRDIMLVDGRVWLAVVDGDLLQVDGRLSRNPSFWTRSVDVVRRYARVAGVRVPVLMESTADVLVAGESHFRMTYDYREINGNPVPASTSTPAAPAAAAAARR